MSAGWNFPNWNKLKEFSPNWDKLKEYAGNRFSESAAYDEKQDIGRRWLSPQYSCYNKDNRFRQSIRGNYWVLYNYIRPSQSFNCDESITYVTHGDPTFMDNLEPLLERWRGPISVGVYAPGTDFNFAVQTILYYRHCTNTSLVKTYATFSFFFDLAHIPENISSSALFHKKSLGVDCGSYNASFSSYKNHKKLSYPVNIARNIARETAVTHFIFTSDIELYPSPGTIQNFLQMIRINEGFLLRPNPRVFVNSIFEIEAGYSLPMNKTGLIELLKKKIIIPFHARVCPQCHGIPQAKKWVATPEKDGMSITNFGKRTGSYRRWEPIYISSNEEPMYDERLSWEGMSDKMGQGYKMCVLDYDFFILDNAFLIHRPGIKGKKGPHNKHEVYVPERGRKMAAQRRILSKSGQEITKLYGARKGCQL